MNRERIPGNTATGKTPVGMFNDSLHIAKEKPIDFTMQTDQANHEGVGFNTAWYTLKDDTNLFLSVILLPCLAYNIMHNRF